ncbi:stomatin family protein, putative [Ichthyophthirius multifiliis]|uniref:Stomatin family protein, putative n=1 Tax=Ichthyophthirius multifiliis TaxID=5932 RepID=G0QJD6_ICHMU|nr:stomatin family protein, putative [Ichthyophthirius multifiliis]EGR34676.1 stomatin family protein, putative [Ichthyophthirius multifiliis]|eukprot:XP_004039980.1 stomatin family protein, putative [Ichthyophthirius multifiliis]
MQNNINEDIQDTGKFTCYENCISCLGKVAGCLSLIPGFCCFPYPYQQIKQSYVGLLEKFGRYQKTLGPGLHQINPFSEQIKIVNLKTNVIDLNRQSIITNDSIIVNIDTVIFYRINEPQKAQYKIQDLNMSLQELTYACLRTVCGENNLQVLLDQREDINLKIGEFMNAQTKQWGVFVEQVFIKDMILDKNIVEELSMVPKSRRIAQSKIISCQSDVQSAILQREASDLLAADSAMQIRYFDTIQDIAQFQSAKTLFMIFDGEQDKKREQK